ncbi:MAG: shikimate dehydrogenase [Chloroflexi bacterium]|jgi:shikimate dehydrogenase|nr:shikimate dehydrogenase [Chloroflexota bacterium]MBT4003786.1 shikimate dehydrogenase [Chloroflexota bacterium]MBT4305688.1 shikimate dehydrogenase [Chloroflexota bacterium]MBT4533512.1 shikimate dehydrogenase [Chloroflexota bacterium]MBT4681845.1 shikimate dehydrogenase [Chloroflexota bacterium]
MNNFRLGLVGYPVSHSLSPIIHKAALESFGLMGSYDLFPIKPFPEGKPDLINLLLDVKKQKISGLNVTVPHKQNILNLVDELSPTARAIRAVNTVYLRDNTLIGDNTDGKGFSTSLLSSSLIDSTKPKVALILGAGGSARAVVHALAKDGWKIIIAARRIAQTQGIITSMPPHLSKDALVTSTNILDIEGFLEESQILVNTTPVGMHPNIADNPWPPHIDYPSHLNLIDLIYNPGKTTLSKLAETAGAQTINGLGMLIEQAALSFELWTGKIPDRKILTQAVQTNL